LLRWRGILLRLGLLCHGLLCEGSGLLCNRRGSGNVGGLGGLLLHWCGVSQLEEASGRLSTAPRAGTPAALVVA